MTDDWVKCTISTMSRLKTARGFTIVELLIVIVVIGILAAITIVAFNGIQDRAKNTNRVQAALAYHKIIKSYITNRSVYPVVVGATTTWCLGEGYPDMNADGAADDCFATNNVKKMSATLNNELRKEVSSLPNYDKEVIYGTGAVGYLGVAYRGITIDGQVGRVGLFYYLKGTGVDCGTSDLIVSDGSGGYVAGNNITYTSTSSGVTTCVLPVQDPATL